MATLEQSEFLGLLLARIIHKTDLFKWNHFPRDNYIEASIPGRDSDDCVYRCRKQRKDTASIEIRLNSSLYTHLATHRESIEREYSHELIWHNEPDKHLRIYTTFDLTGHSTESAHDLIITALIEFDEVMQQWLRHVMS